MTCPHCGVDVAAATSFCTHCGGALATVQPYAAATTVPLTAEQQTWLKLNTTLPILTLVPMLGGILLMLFCVVGSFVSSPFVKGFAIIAALLLFAVVVAVAIHVRSHRADVRAGVAQVRVARLVRKRATSQSPRVFYGEFDQVGSLKVMHELYQHLVEGQSYRVTYSPHTKKCWSADPAAAPQ